MRKLLSLLFLLIIFVNFSYASELKISPAERKRSIIILKKLIDNHDKDVLDLLEYYSKNKLSTSKYTESRRTPEGNMSIVENNTAWMNLELNLEAENIQLEKNEWAYVDQKCQHLKQVEEYDQCRFDIAMDKKRFSKSLEKCFSQALKLYPDKLRNEPVEVEQNYIDSQGIQRKFNKMIGPFSLEEIENKRRSSKNDCMQKDNWVHPRDWTKGKINTNNG